VECDVSKNIDQQPSVALLQYVWGGWHLGQEAFMQLFDQLNDRYRNVVTTTANLIDKNDFIGAKSLDFYRIMGVGSIQQPGLERIRDLLNPSLDGAPTEKNCEYHNFFEWLGHLYCVASQSWLIGGHQKDPRDQIFFNKLMGVIGKGDEAVGKKVYIEACEKEHTTGRGGKQLTTYWQNGTVYPCMSSWVNELLSARRSWPTEDKKLQTYWYTNVLYTLEDHIALDRLFDFVGEKNHLFELRLDGYRKNSEDGDLEYFPDTSGDPSDHFEVIHGIFDYYAKTYGIIPLEVSQTKVVPK
jgi:hypothetical protein